MKEKQIEEMAGIILASYTPRHAAENLYNVGYRKQSEGEWEKDRNGRTCSECGFKYYASGGLFSYCPDCGAKMDRERKEKRDDQEM